MLLSLIVFHCFVSFVALNYVTGLYYMLLPSLMLLSCIICYCLVLYVTIGNDLPVYPSVADSKVLVCSLNRYALMVSLPLLPTVTHSGNPIRNRIVK